jgi:integrase/recombinase XerD
MARRDGRSSTGVLDPCSVGQGPVEELLGRYRRYLVVERELAPTTVVGYVDRVRPFLAARVTADGLDVAGLTAADVNAFVLADCRRRRTRQSVKLTVTALRSLLRYLHARGVIGEELAEGVPSVAGWRLSRLPQHLEPGQVQALFEGCNRATRSGARAFAILKLLVRLGLRRCEVARLCLDDIDWRAGEVVIRGKRDRHDRLPLPPDVGQALVDYLHRARPNEVADRHVFISLSVPYRALTGIAISDIVARRGVAVGLGEIGAHRLRHTAATTMLAQGVGLAQIGQALRHRDPANTAIYAKVDRETLRLVACPWPGVRR